MNTFAALASLERSPLLRPVIGNVVVAALYVALGYVGLQLAVPPGYATVIWPAAGVAVAVVLLFGNYLAIGVLLGSWAINTINSGALSDSAVDWLGLAVALAIAVGSTMQCLAARYLAIRLFGMPLKMKSGWDLLVFGAMLGPIVCLVAATVGLMTLIAAGYVQPASALDNWLTWWAGDMIGVAVILPLAVLSPLRPGSVVWSERPVANYSFPALLALLIPLGLTFYVWKYTSEAVYDRGNSTFQSLADDHEHALLYRLDSYLQGLEGAAGLIMASNWVNLAEWRSYVNTLNIVETLPGISGIGFINELEDGDIDDFLIDAERDGIAEINIHPDMDTPANFIIRYIEPLNANRQAVGLNIAFEEHRFEAATTARDTATPTITRRIFLVQDSAQSSGFLLLRPLYVTGAPLNSIAERRMAFLGWVYAPFIASRFMSDLSTSQGVNLDVSIYDGHNKDQTWQIFSTTIDSENANERSRFTVQRTLEVFGQPWTIVWSSTRQFERSINSNEALFVILGGLGLTLLFAIYLHSFSRREEQVRRTVAIKTREIEEGQRRLDEAIENAPIGMALLDLEGKWIKVNEAIVKFLGYGREEFVSLDFQTITHKDDLATDVELVERLLSGEISSYQLEKRYIHKEGHIVWGNLAVSLARDFEGAPAYFISQILDINDRKEVDRMKQEFVSNVSHELRTPLTSIRGSLGLIVGTMSSAIPENVMRLLGIAHKNSERLIVLINDILDSEKLSADKVEFHLKPENIAELIKLSVEANQGYAADFGIELRAEVSEVPAVADVDSARFQQVMSNVISNAIKFSPRGGRVELGIEQLDHSLRVAVRDYGEGIPSAFKSRIFTPFSQADASTKREKGGTGLGLHISKQLMERMGGAISFESKEGFGTTFFLDLPPRQKASPSLPSDLVGLPKALHVEDDVDFHEFLRTALSDRLNMQCAGTKQEALALLQANDFDVLVLDIGLPDGNGIELLKMLPKNWSGSIVAVTAVEDAEDPLFEAVLVKSKHREEDVIAAISEVADRYIKRAS